MEKNVLLLYMSVYKPTLKEDGTLNRPQTNEAAVKHLQAKQADRPELIIALCSEDVCDKVTVPGCGCNGSPQMTTLAYFQSIFLPRVGITDPDALKVIRIPNSMNEKDQTRAIGQLLPYIQAEAALSVDLSGGMRDTAMLLLTIARYLESVKQTNTRYILCGELVGEETRIKDSSNLYNMMDYISAVDEFFSVGSAKRLQRFLRREGEQNPESQALLTAINTFADDLALCRVRQLRADLKKIARALQDRPAGAESLNGLLFRLMNERFEQEFSGLLEQRADGLPVWVSWCVDHGMIQQALTLLCEGMPEYVVHHVFLRPTQAGLDFLATQPDNLGKSWVVPLFHFHFCRLRGLKYTCSEKKKANIIRYGDLRMPKDHPDNNWLYRFATEGEVRDYLHKTVLAGELLMDEQQQETLIRLVIGYQKVVQCRNRINHANDVSSSLAQEGVLSLQVEVLNTELKEMANQLTAISGMTPQVPEGQTALLGNELIK